MNRQAPSDFTQEEDDINRRDIDYSHTYNNSGGDRSHNGNGLYS